MTQCWATVVHSVCSGGEWGFIWKHYKGPWASGRNTELLWSKHRGAAEDNETPHRNQGSSTSHSLSLPCINIQRYTNTQILNKQKNPAKYSWTHMAVETEWGREWQMKTVQEMKMWSEVRRMYLDPIYWIMDNSSLRLLEEEWRERKRSKGETNEDVSWCQKEANKGKVRTAEMWVTHGKVEKILSSKIKIRKS